MVNAIVIGAGPAGLAAAAALKGKGIAVDIIERAMDVGSSWRGHYDSLHLHTSRGRSALPGLAFQASAGRYPSRASVVQYLDDYAAHHGITPCYGQDVTQIVQAGGVWQVDTQTDSRTADIVVVATGLNGAPKLPYWDGQDSYLGEIIHSADYKNAEPYRGQRVLVVGFGNSGGDISCDLARARVQVSLSQRGPVNILPKELFGLPITSFGLLSKLLGYKAADAITAPILRMLVGRPEDYGLTSTGKGPGARVIEDGRIPLIDVGTLGEIKAERIMVRPAIAKIAGKTVRFADGRAEDYDTIIAATGYSVDLRPLLGSNCTALTTKGQPRVSGAPTDLPGLYFCSFRASPDGQLFATGREALAIADHASNAFTLATA